MSISKRTVLIGAVALGLVCEISWIGISGVPFDVVTLLLFTGILFQKASLLTSWLFGDIYPPLSVARHIAHANTQNQAKNALCIARDCFTPQQKFLQANEVPISIHLSLC